MRIIIAGASGGIGRYLAECLSQNHKVYGTYKTRKPDSNICYKMDRLDVTNEHDVADWINQYCDENDDLALIYCVGINYNRMIHKADSKQWFEVIESNLIGVQHILRYLIPLMRVRSFGRIVLLSSVVPQIGVSGTSAYAASKSALWGLSKAVAKENATHGITINTINLGYFDIGMIQDVPDDTLNTIVSNIPMRKLGDPENILKSVEFLLSVDYMTGSTLDLNGGLF